MVLEYLWNKNKQEEMGTKTTKFMTMTKEMHPRSDVARLHVSRKIVEEDLLDVKIV